MTSKPFKPLNIAVLTVSDTRTPSDDRSGDTLVDRRPTARLAARAIVGRGAEIAARLYAWIDDPGVDVVITTGGTGLTGRDVTPEAFDIVCESRSGFGELFRWISCQKIAIPSRAGHGGVTGTYLFALPGSPGACRGGWDGILHFSSTIATSLAILRN